MLVDPEVFALAQHFLDTESADKQVQSLADAIQSAVEDWFTLEQVAQGDAPPTCLDRDCQCDLHVRLRAREAEEVK